MASNWIKCLVSLPDQPEVTGIARRLNLDPDAVVGKLIRFWAWADSVTTDGVIPHVDAAYLDDKARKKGFAEAMAAVGWLVMTSEGIEIPKYDRHNGTSAKRRAENTDRKRQSRDGVSNSGHEVVTQLARRLDDKGATREEKRERRKEKTKDTNINARAREFDIFWSSYPRQVNKRSALIAWNLLDPSVLIENIVEAIAEQKESDQGRRGVWRNPAKWLYERGWEDRLPAVMPNGIHKPGFEETLTAALGTAS